MPVPPGSQTIELEIPLLARTEAHWRVASCIDQNCTFSATVGADRSILNRAIQRIESPYPQTDARFGYDVGISGNGQVLAAGAPGQNNAGSVYIYQKINGQWIFTQELIPSNAQAEDEFGISLSLSNDGHTLIIGAEGKNQEAGAAYVFEYDGREWRENSYLTAPNPQAEAHFGSCVTLDPTASIIAVGAPREPVPVDSSNKVGAVYVFAKDGNTWKLRDTISAPQQTEAGGFGTAIALSFGGARLAISAPAMVNPGTVYLYQRFVNDWNLQKTLQARNSISYDNFGHSISFNGAGTLLAVGAPRRDGLTGYAYIFEYRSSDWQEAVGIPSDGLELYLGRTVLLDRAGTRLIIGAPLEGYVEGGINNEVPVSPNSNSGAIFYFTKQADGSWEGKSYAKAIEPKVAAFFGFSAAIDNRAETVVVGAPFENFSSDTQHQGAIYLY